MAKFLTKERDFIIVPEPSEPTAGYTRAILEARYSQICWVPLSCFDSLLARDERANSVVRTDAPTSLRILDVTWKSGGVEAPKLRRVRKPRKSKHKFTRPQEFDPRVPLP
jgi:hypothetical protein